MYTDSERLATAREQQPMSRRMTKQKRMTIPLALAVMDPSTVSKAEGGVGPVDMNAQQIGRAAHQLISALVREGGAAS